MVPRVPLYEIFGFSSAVQILCCAKHQEIAEAMLISNKTVHDVIENMQRQSSEAMEELQLLKRKLSKIVRVHFL